MAKVNFKRIESIDDLDSIPIEDGNFIVTGDGKTYIDYGSDRKGVGGTPDTEMSDTSINSVQNKVIKKYIDNNAIKIGENEESNQILEDSKGNQLDPLIPHLECEIINNDNAIAIKYENGTMICAGNYTGKSTLSTYFTQFMRSAENIKVSFPATFLSNPYVVLQPTYSTYTIANILNSVSTSGFGFTALKGRDITNVSTVACHYIAIGKWK